jgi:hypothetical protein
MLIGSTWPPKQPTETWVVEADFVNELAEGETIASAEVTSILRNTGADSTDNFLTGTPGIAGSKVSMRTVGGAVGDTHRLQFTIHTAAPFSNIIQHEIDVPVADFAR